MLGVWSIKCAQLGGHQIHQINFDHNLGKRCRQEVTHHRGNQQGTFIRASACIQEVSYRRTRRKSYARWCPLRISGKDNVIPGLFAGCFKIIFVGTARVESLAMDHRSRWWQLKYSLFSPLLGEIIQSD